MSKQNINRINLKIVVLLLIAFSLNAFGQGKSSVDEKNVRAQMQFLAGDAMQGRGSGTAFERIAAEYIGSQFMQFGLEPAGEDGWDGKPTFVRTVTNTRSSFDGNPTLKYGSSTAEHGKEMLVLRATGTSVSGTLQKIGMNDKPAAGSAVFIRLPADAPANPMQGLMGMATAGASIVLVEETAQYRANWANMAGRRISFTSAAKPSAIIVVSKDVASAISAMPDGTNIEFGGKATSTQLNTWNAMGKITGSDPKLASEVILLTSHLDHLGVRENAPGTDKIFNGADDDASGSVAVLEMARVLGAGKKPKRTVYFVCFGSEEAGGYGAGWFVNNLPVAKDKLVANLEFEMIGRPDEKVKPEELWLTGYERSNLGPELAKRGAKLVQDPHPEQNFFQRSDNIQLARQGIIAHTVSSFGLHKDYHQASDEVKTIDFVHMTRSINSMVKPIQWLINSNFVPAWVEGKKP
ncbi:MAG: M20/M25/M40 family metallo-hydrolase [Pyrinomonadaceae bacterium]